MSSPRLRERRRWETRRTTSWRAWIGRFTDAEPSNRTSHSVLDSWHFHAARPLHWNSAPSAILDVASNTRFPSPSIMAP